MSYLVLARKWRPLGFDDLIGQEPIVRILTNSIRQEKIAHAYIFSGPRGVGKTSTARILAKALNCEKGPTAQPCGSCPSCTSITDGHSIDVIEIDGASNNGVDAVRDLRERVKYAPSGGKYKVYIIDEAHMVTGPAFNALLKTLEEPPPHVVFVMATTDPRKIPVTVLSRCQHLPFRRVSTREIKGRLRLISDAEGLKAPDSALAMIARAADGSIRDSLTILDQAASVSSEINESDLMALLGIMDFRVVSQMAEAVIGGDRGLILDLSSGLVDAGTDLRVFVKDFIKFLRDLLVTKILSQGRGRPGVPDAIALDAGEEEFEALSGLAGRVSEEHLSLLLNEAIKCESDVRTSFSPRVALEMSLIKLSYLSMFKPVSEAIASLNLKGLPAAPEATPQVKAPQQVKTAAQQVEAEAPQVKAEAPQVKALPQAEAVVKPQVIAKPIEPARPAPAKEISADALLKSVIKKIDDPRISSKLDKAHAELEGDTLILTFNSTEADICADPIKENSALISEAASAIRGSKTGVEIRIKQSAAPPTKKDLKEKIMSEPLVKEALELFDGRIVDVRLTEGG